MKLKTAVVKKSWRVVVDITDYQFARAVVSAESEEAAILEALDRFPGITRDEIISVEPEEKH